MDFVRSHRNEGALLGAVVVFGVNYPIFKLAADQLGPFPLNAVRFMIAALVMGYLLRGDLAQSLQRFRTNWKLLSVLALVGYLLSPLFLVYGLQYSTATNAALILAGAPIWTALLSWLIGNDRIGPAGWVGLFVSTVGLIVVTVSFSESARPGPGVVFGNVLLFADSILWGSYVSLQRNLLERTEPLEASFWSLIVVLPLLIAGSIGTATPADGLLALSPSTWGALLFSGVFSMGLAHLWWNVSLKDFGPTTVSVYGNGIPVVAVLVGWFFLGEALYLRHLVGGSIILIGVLMARTDNRRRKRTAGTPES